MVMYECEACNYVSKYKKDYNKHLKTKTRTKFKRNRWETTFSTHFTTILPFSPFTTFYFANFVKKYSRIDSLNRHKKRIIVKYYMETWGGGGGGESNRTKESRINVGRGPNNEIKALREEMDLQRNHLMKQIELLLTKWEQHM